MIRKLLHKLGIHQWVYWKQRLVKNLKYGQPKVFKFRQCQICGIKQRLDKGERL